MESVTDFTKADKPTEDPALMMYLWSEVLGKNGSLGVFIVPTTTHAQRVISHSGFHLSCYLSAYKEVHICEMVKHEMLQTLGFLAFFPAHHSQGWVVRSADLRDSPQCTHLPGEGGP